jgi:hypothetical protein
MQITDQPTNLKHAHDTITVLVAPVARQGGTAEHPSSKVCLARGLHASSGEVRLARGLNAPSGGVRPAEGYASSGEVRLAQGPPSRTSPPLLLTRMGIKCSDAPGRTP